ncbi:hypothetical protein ACQPZP_22460 [Spirillospora sp. CA-142024]|uniref:hypothetical protein n=1 Tax=Spirillospora sp. CA-142024 TaxID=3240036 RepID=UPI003D919BAE
MPVPDPSTYYETEKFTLRLPRGAWLSGGRFYACGRCREPARRTGMVVLDLCPLPPTDDDPHDLEILDTAAWRGDEPGKQQDCSQRLQRHRGKPRMRPVNHP